MATRCLLNDFVGSMRKPYVLRASSSMCCLVRHTRVGAGSNLYCYITFFDQCNVCVGIPLAAGVAAAWYDLFGEDKGLAYNRKEPKDHGEVTYFIRNEGSRVV